MTFRKQGLIAFSVATAVLSLTATAAFAATTTVRTDSATGAPYSGDVTGALISNSAHFQSGFVQVDCTGSGLAGSVNSDGSNLSVSSASWDNCDNSLGGTTTTTALELPWSGGSVVHDPQAGGRDGTMTIVGLLAKSDNKDSLGITTTCYYKGSGSGGSITTDVYNPDNTNRPEPDSEAQAHADAEPLTLVDDATYNSGAACSSTATFTAVYSMNGAQGAKLFITS